MANFDHLIVLKQGVKIWNKWRQEHPAIRPDFIGAFFINAFFIGTNLSGVDLSNAVLAKACFIDADLRNADLCGANLRQAHLKSVDLSNAVLIGADLRQANLCGANLCGANLTLADLSEADLTRANLNKGDLSKANLSGANLTLADLSEATMELTLLGNVDLSRAKGLDTMFHQGPSTIGIDTIFRSQGNISETFLKDAGVPDNMIEYMHSLVVRPIDYYSCFISYSSKDHAFADRLHADLQSKHVRCWFAPKDMKIRDKIRPRIDESIRIHDKLLLVVSEHSLTSDWVETEVETAFEREYQQSRLVLFPIRLDDTVEHTKQAWAANIRRTRHIGDFRRWKNYDDYQRAFTQLLRDLKAENNTNLEIRR